MGGAWSACSMQIRLCPGALLVDEPAGGEAVEPEGRRGLVRLVAGDEVREAVAGGRRRLEAAVAPAGIEIEPSDGRAVDDGRTVHRHVHDAAPVTQNADA